MAATPATTTPENLAPGDSAPSARMAFVYDGHCVLCSAMARHVLARDPGGRIRLVAAQSLEGRALYKRTGLTAGMPTTNLFVERDGCILTHSDSSLRILEEIGYPAALLRAARLVPRSLRDAAYVLVARSRFRLFGRHATCQLVPRPEAAPDRPLDAAGDLARPPAAVAGVAEADAPPQPWGPLMEAGASARRKLIVTLKTLLVFGLLGPPIGSFTFVTSVMALASTNSGTILSALGVIKFMISATMMGSVFAYASVAHFALLCGAITSVTKFMTARSDLQIITATIAGLLVGIYVSWDDVFQVYASSSRASGAHLIMVFVIPSFCCAWLAKRI